MNAGSRGFSGCRTWSSSSSATTFTGGGTVVLRCRPCGLSGCVTTATTSQPSPNNARSGGVANSGVPQKRTRMSLGLAPRRPVSRDRRRSGQDASLPGVFLLEVFPPRHDAAPLEEAQVIDEQLAMQVVDFVLERARQQFIRFALEGLSLEVGGAHGDPRRAIHIAVNVGNRKASLFGAFATRFGDDFGIDEDDGIVVHVHDGDALETSDLWRGEADPLRGAHGLEHVVHQAPEI